MGAIKNDDVSRGFKSLKAAKQKRENGFKSEKQTEYERLINSLYSVLPTLTHHQMKLIKKIVHKQFLKKFAKNQPPKYGSLNKGFTEQEVQMFFRVIDNPKLRLLFSYQAQLGLRVGEAVKLNIKDIDFQTRELTIKSEKSNTLDTLIIPIPLFRLTLEYIKPNNKQIESSMGYIFFKEEGYYSERNEQYLSKNYVRNRFRYYVQKAGMDKVYDSSDETNYDRTPRSLHRLTMHSLRHYAITSFLQADKRQYHSYSQVCTP
ncbi:site-specific integrase [Candidatus Marsarchaeota archaeon]|nr:site-specific integrase [Candidatus Marsarchaeota archaeon]